MISFPKPPCPIQTAGFPSRHLLILSTPPENSMPITNHEVRSKSHMPNLEVELGERRLYDSEQISLSIGFEAGLDQDDGPLIRSVMTLGTDKK